MVVDYSQFGDDHMTSKRRYALLFAIIACAALPATSAYVLYEVTDNPTLRPLGITQERLASVNGGPSEGVSILVRVDWGADRRDGITQRELREIIASTLSSRTDSFVFQFEDVPGSEIGITFSVGVNSYGPFPKERMIDGIMPSLIALDATKRARGNDRS
jgi:hypothetical protein